MRRLLLYRYRTTFFNPCKGIFSVLLVWLTVAGGFAQERLRQDISLNQQWLTIARDSNQHAYDGFESAAFSRKGWLTVSVPHNWDTYEGYRRLKHGNRHGYAWYTKTFRANKQAAKQYFLWFEGVGSYATVWLNGVRVGYHAGGRTSFTLDVTKAIKTGSNLLAVRADHPAFITDLPWVCGGCSDDPGFSEGSQPMGIFRPVHLIVTNPVRIAPFGVHVWNDTTVTERSATLNLETEVKNYGTSASSIRVVNELKDVNGKTIAQAQSSAQLSASQNTIFRQQMRKIGNVQLWSLENPYLYQVVTSVYIDGKLTDQTSTPYGIRWISWPIGRNNGDNRFYLNGKPVFINGTAEYEHLMGKSHAFSNEEIRARVMQVKAAGFNAFRDAHQPHNLEYQKYWDKLGILWWPQYSAHIWYDKPEFRKEFKALLRDWIRERRNSPSVILWGLQNESRLPEDFAKECSAIIREMDPTASSQRKITTCNGGRGTDWDVPQNWTGTYGGDPRTYAQDLQKQLLVGEYGAWRSLEMHTSGPFVQNGPLSEDRMTQLMETKVRLAESVRDKVPGQFHWLLYSHENPGRTQGGEGYRELDRVGPVNYKGLFTPWGQPADAFYMYRANYAPKEIGPMVYIVSHTWPNRWLKPGKEDSITVYSNCDEVELFNDVNAASLGKKSRGGTGTHFQWDGVDVKYNVLYVIGYVKGKAVAKDYIVLNHLPQAPHMAGLVTSSKEILKPTAGYHYLYRVNCGGPDYTDTYGHTWLADRHQDSDQQWGSRSWTDDYPGMPAFFASQQRSFNPVNGTADSRLFQSFRYGMNKLSYNFPLPNGDYQVELFFNEPWYGTGGGMDCSGWRLFDVALNDKVVLHNLDIWKEAGYNTALKKSAKVHVTDGKLTIAFPNEEAGEALVSAIAISTLNNVNPVKSESRLIRNLKPDAVHAESWLDIGDHIYSGSNTAIAKLPPVLYGAEWLKTPDQSIKQVTFEATKASDIYVGVDIKPASRPDWLKDYEVTGLTMLTDENGGTELYLYRKRLDKPGAVTIGNDLPEKYFLAVLPATHMEPASDLRTTISYKAEGAVINGQGFVADTVSGRKVIKIGAAHGSVVFNINPGVADAYAIRIKYYNQTDRIFTAKMELRAADGTLMKAEQLTFKPFTKNKSGTVATTTGTSINAGNYTISIIPVDANGLVISGIEIQ